MGSCGDHRLSNTCLADLKMNLFYYRESVIQCLGS